MKVETTSIFFPRGGSAQVLRYLGREMRRHNISFDLSAGSMDGSGRADARVFYGDLCRDRVDYRSSADRYPHRDAIAQDPPMHPSYEDKSNVPDRWFARVAPQLTDHLESFWKDWFSSARHQDLDIIHLNHLTPMQVGARASNPSTPIAATMHGTEIKFIQSLADWVGPAPDEQSKDAPAYVPFWRSKMQEYLAATDRLIVISQADRQTLQTVGHVPAEKICYIPHGVDTTLFRPRTTTTSTDTSLWQKLLVSDATPPLDHAERPLVSYEAGDVTRLCMTDPKPVRLLWLGRFLHQKRLTQLLTVFAEVTATSSTPAVLIVWGGFPGEHEGTHPVDVVNRAGIADKVFFTGWRDHTDLSEALPTVDVLAVPAVNESFGLMYLEAMACGLPVIATSTGGPRDYVVGDGPDANGWLVGPDDNGDLAAALRQAIDNADERRRRGRNAGSLARERFSWSAVATSYIELFEEMKRTKS